MILSVPESVEPLLKFKLHKPLLANLFRVRSKERNAVTLKDRNTLLQRPVEVFNRFSPELLSRDKLVTSKTHDDPPCFSVWVVLCGLWPG